MSVISPLESQSPLQVDDSGVAVGKSAKLGGVPVGVTLGVAVTDMVGVGVTVFVTVPDGVGVRVPVAVPVRVAVID